jgi:hypothetical protein
MQLIAHQWECEQSQSHQLVHPTTKVGTDGSTGSNDDCERNDESDSTVLCHVASASENQSAFKAFGSLRPIETLMAELL